LRRQVEGGRRGKRSDPGTEDKKNEDDLGCINTKKRGETADFWGQKNGDLGSVIPTDEWLKNEAKIVGHRGSKKYQSCFREERMEGDWYTH